ncbi:5-(carboxyamino)imidazole ribonucleotide synthase [Marinobacterium arenosum]|uniref:5-(carboxyamino)imidazole ribonucleotide synthase n=1 Tax=Marinobacterium arenosum TaxID=2862496 RepID=UPI001C9861C6|nr:5-(carboxyamino)imidazole ribonucleotide synthase [Marinobacterium arenosum]MBY4678113.1 5-(carboxyamino)imidazole ribonucleotide synthase [Marinobacterium arenosum]
MHVAIVGCGQLARMMALEGWPLGLRFSFLAAPGEDDRCVRGLGDVVEVAGDESPELLFQKLGCPDVVTVEREEVDVTLLTGLQHHCVVYPPPQAIADSQHRGREKRCLNRLGITTAPYRLVDELDDLPAAVGELGYPVFIKACRNGYDGRNQWRLSDAQGLERFMAEQAGLTDLVVEAQVPFEREVSLIAVRSRQGDLRCYPLTENRHRDGILISSIAPAAGLGDGLHEQAQWIARRLLTHWDYVGVLSIECFVAQERLIVNEVAPRVHNSGHWSQQGSACSQFENHLRAVCGMSLGATDPLQHAGMVNMLGDLAPADVLNQPNVHPHLYGKSSRARRKMGHLNLVHGDRAALEQQLAAIVAQLHPSG